MNSRRVQDAIDLKTKEKVYLKGHAKVTYMSDGISVEDAIKELQDRLVAYSNVEASSWVEDTSVAGYSYRCDLACTGVNGLDYAEVLFTKEDSLSGNYSSICETKEDKVSIWGVLNSPIIIPLILIERVENAE